MSDLSITAASVIAGSDSVRERGTAGAAITAGQNVYKSSTTGKYLLADNNSGTAAARVSRGIALNGAADGQPLEIHREGDIAMGATLTPGIAYYLSDTPGGICPVADVGAGEDVCLIGIARSASVLAVKIQAPGVAL